MRAPLGLLADVVPFSWVDGPGNRTTVFLQGCNFDCLACHNPQTIPKESVHATRVTVDELVSRIAPNAPFLAGVTVSGGEATAQADFLRAFFAALGNEPATARLTRFIDSNGSASAGTWDALAPVTEGVMVDLKAFDPQLHLELTSQPLQPVLDSIRHLHGIRRLHEVRLLPVPGVNDDPGLLTQTGEWLAGIDPGLRVVINPFHRHGVRSPADSWAEPGVEQLEEWAGALRAAGLEQVVVVRPLGTTAG